MSSVHPSRGQRGFLSALFSLIFASLAGLAASVIHGAFDHKAVRARKAAAPRRTEPVESTAQGSGAGVKGPRAGPSDSAPRGWWEVLKRTVSEVGNDRVLTVAGGVTFYGLLSLFPALTVLVSL